jgi:hypothetical protein
MKRRFLPLVAILALLAIAVRVLRPVVQDATGAPFGAHNSPDVQLTRADGSPHCTLLADCETVSISNAGIDLALAVVTLVLAGIVVAVAPGRPAVPRTSIVLVPNPPPLSVLS